MQRVASNGQRTRVINSGHHQRVARIEQPAGAAPIVQGQAVSIGPAVEADPVIWTARLRTGRVVILRASGSRAFRAVALIASAAGVDLAAVIDSVVAAGIASAVEVDLVVAVIDLVAAGDLGAAASAGSAAVAADSGADAEN